MGVLSEELRAKADELVARYPRSRSALLPLLYLVQAEEGHVTREGMQEVAQILGLTTAEVEAVASFYTMFKRRPAGDWVVSVCTNVSCAVRGARGVYKRAREVLGDDAEAGSAGSIALEEVECLGACDGAPVVQVNYANYERVTEDGVAELIEGLRTGEPSEPTRGPKPVDHRATSRILAGLGDERA